MLNTILRTEYPFIVQALFRSLETGQDKALVTYLGDPASSSAVYRYIHRSGITMKLPYGEYLPVESIFTHDAIETLPLGTILIHEFYALRGRSVRMYILQEDGVIYRTHNLTQEEIDWYYAGVITAADLM